MKLNQILLIFVFSLVLFFACAGQEGAMVVTTPKTPASDVKGFENMREDFDPAALDDYDIEVEEPHVGFSGMDDPTLKMVEMLKDSIGPGYRVQLIQTTEPEEAKNTERDAILRFDEGVYRIFDPPFYKFRVGDFADWYDAEKIQKLAIQKGFREAWVVRTKVNLKKAYKWIEEL
ncbi:hypothetical protein IID10_19410 [candidate division KSB1 bacterium]|nr:hypothetical protein [candidate division KSB1 bacterium]